MVEFLGIVGSQEAAAGFLGDALHLQQGVGFAPHIEANDMGGKIYARFFQCAGGGAGIRIAGLDPIGNQDHRRRLFGVAQRLSRGDDGIGHRGHAPRVQPFNDAGDLCRSAGRGFDQGFDIRALPALAMAIGDETEILIGGEIRHNVPDDIARDGDFVYPIDLPPHRPRGVQNKDRAGALLGKRRRRKGGCQGDKPGGHKRSHAASPSRAVPKRASARSFSLRKCEDICSSRASHSGSGSWPSVILK